MTNREKYKITNEEEQCFHYGYCDHGKQKSEMILAARKAFNRFCNRHLSVICLKCPAFIMSGKMGLPSFRLSSCRTAWLELEAENEEKQR